MDPTRTVVQPAAFGAAAAKSLTGAAWADVLLGIGLALLLVVALPFGILRSGMRLDVVHWSPTLALYLLAGPLLGLLVLVLARSYRAFAWGLGVSVLILGILEAFIVVCAAFVLSFAASMNGRSSSARIYNPQLKVGAAPIPFHATDMDGNRVSLDEYRGKVVLLDFWATWCGPCVGEAPNVVATYRKEHGRGLEIIGVSLDRDPAAMRTFTAKEGLTWPQVFDIGAGSNGIAMKYGVQAIPFTVLIGRDGRIAAIGARGADLEPAVERALNSPGAAQR